MEGGPSFEPSLKVREFEKMCQIYNFKLFKWEELG
jgi:hypothetical protein